MSSGICRLSRCLQKYWHIPSTYRVSSGYICQQMTCLQCSLPYWDILKHTSLVQNRSQKLSSLAFVPKYIPAQPTDIEKLQNFLNSSSKLFILTGAGISTESGIPDYRSEEVGLYARSDKRPVKFKDFMESAVIRQRYWARNYIGWPRFSSFLPSKSHECLNKWEESGRVQCIVTQNVDRLHHKAGSKNVIELHGTAFQVVCMSCKKTTCRYDFQQVLAELNPHMVSEVMMIRPDGDVDLTQDQIEGFKVPSCSCGGILKPDIVFFGDNVPVPRIEAVREEMKKSDSFLVIGSSLQVFSGMRFILQASERKIPVAILNIGETRGDKYAELKINTMCGEVLPRIIM